MPTGRKIKCKVLKIEIVNFARMQLCNSFCGDLKKTIIGAGASRAPG